MDWISVEERLPEESNDVICAVSGKVTAAYFVRHPSSAVVEFGYWEFVDDCEAASGADVTHWMPYPELPGKGET